MFVWHQRLSDAVGCLTHTCCCCDGGAVVDPDRQRCWPPWSGVWWLDCWQIEGVVVFGILRDDDGRCVKFSKVSE